MATTYAIDALDNFVREELPSTIYESLPEIAPQYKYIEQTSMGVQRSGVGRDWVVEHLFGGGVAGMIQSADPRGPSIYDNTYSPQSKFLDTSGLSIFPTATYGAHTTSILRQLSLHLNTGNFSIPITWIQGDALDASQISLVTREIKAVGEMRAQMEALSFFMPQNNALAQIESLDSTGIASGYFTFKVKPGTGRTSYFRPGMLVDIVADSSGPCLGTDTDGTDIKNYTYTTPIYMQCVVASVDYIGGTIRIASANPSLTFSAGTSDTTITVAIADGDWITWALSTSFATARQMKTWGLEDWIKSGVDATATRYIMGGASSSDQGLDLVTWPQFKSQVVAVNGPLTDTVMNGYIGGYLDAYPGASLDTIITTMGVTLKYLEQPQLYNNRMFFDRQGKALDVKGGWEDVNYSFNGRVFRWMVSPMCISGYLYGLKLGGGNIKRYVPPKASGGAANVSSGSDSRIGDEIEFLAPMAGNKNIFKIAHASTGASQALLEAPFWQYSLICPIDVKAVKLTGLTEASMY